MRRRDHRPGGGRLPGQPPHRRGDLIPKSLEADPDIHVFHAGTAMDGGGVLRVAGGRVLSVTATAPTVAEAAARSRAAAEAIGFEGKQFRRDIGWREITRRR